MNIIKLIISILICQLAGIIGSFFTKKAIITWYVNIQKPSFNPPNWIFAPVWISLYCVMGISLFIIWKTNSSHIKKYAILFFSIQLILNALWSILFFGLKSPIAGFIDIILLWIAIVLTTIFFTKIKLSAGILMIPYLLWVSFALILNYYIVKLN